MQIQYACTCKCNATPCNSKRRNATQCNTRVLLRNARIMVGRYGICFYTMACAVTQLGSMRRNSTGCDVMCRVAPCCILMCSNIGPSHRSCCNNVRCGFFPNNVAYIDGCTVRKNKTPCRTFNTSIN